MNSDQIPQGKAVNEGWFCRQCHAQIHKGDMIYKPKNVWVCEPCFKAGRHEPVKK